MPPPSLAERTRKEEYFEILDETIRTNPYRKAANAMASVMSKHGITSDAGKVLGKPSLGPEKKCALTRALRLAQSCNQKLNVTREELQALCCDLDGKPEKSLDNNNNSSARNKQPPPPPPLQEPPSTATSEGPSERAVMTGHLLTLIGEAQTIAKRIYETAVGLHVAEDYLRQPEDLKLLDFSCNGRIQIPNYNFNHASQLCLEWLHSTAIKWLRGFKEDGGQDTAQFVKVFENFTKAVKDYTEAVCVANQVFRVLLYANTYGKETLQEYVQSLGHVLKNDIMMEVQSLRRAFDTIQYSFERLGWAASIAWMKYSGQNITVETLNQNGIQVDHSIFQHKFYEGPSKQGDSNNKKGKSADVPSLGNKQPVKNAALEKAHSESAKKENGEKIGRRESGSRIAAAAAQQRESTTTEATVTKSRSSHSAPEPSKPRKQVGNKGKARRVDQTNQGVAVADAEATLLSKDDSSTRLGLLKLLKNDRGYSISLSQSTLDSSNGSSSGGKSKASALTLPPTIPSAYRKQFGAVFGTHLVPPPPAKGKGGRKIKKKTAAANSNQKSSKKVGGT